MHKSLEEAKQGKTGQMDKHDDYVHILDYINLNIVGLKMVLTN